MPFGKWANFDSCLADIKKKNPGYSDEVAKKVCGKLQAKLEKGEKINDDDLSPSKEDLREVQPVVKAWEFDPKEIMNSPRKVQGTFHVPKIDKDNEIITKGAMDKAIPNFIHLPILHDFHRERTLGLITKVWEESDAYHFEALFKATHDVDDAWDKVKRGEYDHVSIYGSRLEGNASCALDPANRATPCVSSEIRLDSISACDENARNDSTSLTMRKGIHIYNDITDTFIKAETSNSGLVHGTYDGVERGVRRKDMDKCSKCGTELKAKEPESRGSKILPAVGDIIDLEQTHEKRHKDVEKGEQRVAPNKTSQKVRFTGTRPPKEGEKKVEKSEDEEVEKGDLRENRAGRGDLRDKRSFGADAAEKPYNAANNANFSHENLRSSGRISEPYAKADEEEEMDILHKVAQTLRRLVASDKKVHSTMKKGELDWSKRKESEAESGRKEGVSSSEREDFSRVNRSLEKGEDEEDVEKGFMDKINPGMTAGEKTMSRSQNKPGVNYHAESRKERGRLDAGAGLASMTKSDEEEEKGEDEEDVEKGTLKENRNGRGNMSWGQDVVDRSSFSDDRAMGEGPAHSRNSHRDETLQSRSREVKAKEILTPKHEANEDEEDEEEKKASALMGNLGHENSRQTSTKPVENQNRFVPNKVKKGDEEEKAEAYSQAGQAAVAHHQHNTGHPIRERAGQAAAGREESNEKRFKKGDIMTDEVKEVIQKAPVEKTDEEFVQEIVKANLPKTDEIVKAQMEEISKAFKVQIDELKAEIEKLKNEPIQKAAVFIQEGPTSGVAEQYQAIAQFGKVK